MASEKASQLIILGNGFDLKLGLKTKFEDYLKSFSIDKVIEESKIDILFDNLKKSMKANFGINGSISDFLKDYDIEKEEKQKKTMKEIVSNIGSININNNNFKQKLLLSFYIKIMFNSIELIMQKVRSNSLNSNLSRIGILKKELDKYKKQALSFFEFDKFNDKSSVKLTFWDLYFLYLRKNDATLNEDSNWSDVEYQISEFYQKSDKKPAKYNELLSSNDEILTIIFETLTNKKVTSNDIDEILYDGLKQFSDNFANYLNDIYDQKYDISVDNCWREQTVRDNLIENIASNISHGKYELLNFNYTYATPSSDDNNCVNEINVHGSLNGKNKPIIGINAADLTSNKEHAFKLTKQYQLISNENNKVKKLDLNNINRIVFYGHSLALADYQYFKSIFDRVHLIDSSVELVFKYSIYDEKKKEEILKENYDRIFKLLKRYSDDVNTDVITTLMLDGRVKLQEI